MSISIPSSPSADDLLKCENEPSADRETIGTPFEEKRESHRFPFRGRAKAVLFPSPQSPPGTTLLDSEVVTSDLSRGGVSILCRSRLDRGQQLMLMLSENMQLAEVRWCCPVWDGLFIAGCQFLGDSKTSVLDQQLMAIDVVISNEASWWNPDEKTT